MQKLAETNCDKVLDLLTARLHFERIGVKLYDSVLAKVEKTGDENILRMADELRSYRDEEKEHRDWLEQQIRALGGDPQATTEMTLVEETESEGIGKIILDGDNAVPHCLHALLAAELADNAGWDLLVQLADDVGDREAKREFKKRLHEEEHHLLFVRRAMERCALSEVTHEKVEMPTKSSILGLMIR